MLNAIMLGVVTLSVVAPNVCTIDIERRKNRLLKFCYVPATSAAHSRLLFFLCCGHLQY